jgi:hypothetical protein
MKKITVNDSEYKLVESYSEMNEKQFLKICFIYSHYLVKGTIEEYNSVRQQAFFVLSDIPLKIIKRIEAQQWVDILPHLDFVFSEAPGLKSNLIPKIRIGFKNYYGPNEMLRNVSLYEMMEADTEFVASSNFQNVDKIYLLASILYRPKRRDLRKWRKEVSWNGDIREEYNHLKAIERAKLFEKVPFYKLVGVFIYYFSFREHELVKNPIFSSIFQGKENNLGLNIGWLGTLLEVSDSTFGTLDQTKNQNWKLVLIKIANDLTRKQHLDQKAEEDRIRLNFDK